MRKGITILVVDDEEGIRRGLSRLFERQGYICITTDNGNDAIRYIEQQEIDLAILDVRLKHNERGELVLRELKLKDPELPVLLITGYGSIESAVEAMKNGASDYILKPIDNTHLLETVSRYLELNRLKKDNIFLKKELYSHIYSGEIQSQNSEVLSLIKLADKVKNSSVPVLITGESGTGKELFARYIHFTGNRRDNPFVSINCAALSESLLLSELFGHEKGAFTGATEKQIGKFELAHGGTLFLDEIGDMAPSIQAKLLRVLEESCFERVGGTKKIFVDIRIITATNKNIQELVHHGLFREDLLYRINAVHLHIPPLRERPEDIPLLISYYLKKFSKEYNKPVPSISEDLMEYWKRYKWPGNVRELKNTMHNIVLLTSETHLEYNNISKNSLFPSIELSDSKFLTNLNLNTSHDSKERIINLKFPEPDIQQFPSLAAYSETIREIGEREFIRKILNQVNWNQSKAAKILQISRKTLIRKISQYKIRKTENNE